MAPSSEAVVDLNLKPLREQIEAMRDLLKQAENPDLKLVELLNDTATRMKMFCRAMGVRVTFK